MTDYTPDDQETIAPRSAPQPACAERREAQAKQQSYGLHRLGQSPHCLELGEVDLVWRPRRRSHEGGQAVREATRAYPPIRGGNAPNRGGPDPELALTPGADVHRAAFSSENRPLSTPGLSSSIFGALGCRRARRSPRRRPQQEAPGANPTARPGRPRRLGASSGFLSAPRGRSCPPSPRRLGAPPGASVR